MWKSALILLPLLTTFCPDQVWVQSDSLPSTCTPEFQKVSGHTMCKHDHADVQKSGVSRKDRNLILRMHNKYRRHVIPPATDLTRVYWDDKLAQVANKLAKQCFFAHDETDHRSIPSYPKVRIGQSIGTGYTSWERTIEKWHGEVIDFVYGTDSDNKTVGHYTQIVNNRFYRIGCGYAECIAYERLYVCNYARIQSNSRIPYTKGPTCSSCLQTCKKSLCDCSGLLCLNYGTLDLNTCTCKCLRRYWGKDCSNQYCPGFECLNYGILDLNTCTCKCWRGYWGKDCGNKLMTS